MASKDLVTGILPKADISSGDTLDLVDSESCALILNVINTTSVALQEGDESDGSDKTDVAAEFILTGPGDAGTVSGNDVAYTATGVANIGYVGHKRYLTVTVTNAATDTTIVLLRSDLRNNPYS